MDYFKMYKSVWDFHKKYSDVREDDSYWERVANESSEIAKRYNECKFVVNLSMLTT